MARSDDKRGVRRLLSGWIVRFVTGAAAGLVVALLAPVRVNRARR